MTESVEFAQMFNQFFKNSSRMASTYKPIFLRSLLDIGALADPGQKEKLVGKDWLKIKDGKIFVNLNFIAIRFAKYYWDMEYSFRLRQSQDRQDANITRIVRSAHDSHKKPPTIRELSGDDMEFFRKQVITKSLKPEVLVHLQTDMARLYKKTDSNTISLDADIIDFFHTYKTTITYGLNYVTAKYLEKINNNVPNITRKVEHDPTKQTRKALPSEIQLKMKNWQESKCLYCKNEFESHHVDHVIPFNFVFSTEPFNCVLACQQCNCTKSDMLPDKSLFADVLDRNNEIESFLDEQKTTYDEDKYKILFDTCVAEYNGNKFFKPEI